jgi:hypothetical protein
MDVGLSSRSDDETGAVSVAGAVAKDLERPVRISSYNVQEYEDEMRH